MKKFFKALSIAGICACTFSLTAEAVPLRQSPVPSVEKTAAAVNIPTRNTKVNITASGQVKDNAADKSAIQKKDSRSLKSVILNWQEIPDAAMYELGHV